MKNKKEEKIEKDWTIGYQDAKHKAEIEGTYKSDSKLEEKWEDFERDITTDPYHHTKYRRIVKLKDTKTYPPGAYRYRKDPLRVVYFPEGKTKIIYPLEVGSYKDMAYKKRSK